MRGARGGAARRVTRSHYTPTPGEISRPYLSPIQNLFTRRDSDVSSLGSSLPSSSVATRPPSSSSSAAPDSSSLLRSVNSYLSSLSPSLHLKPPFPPTRDVADALRAIFSRLDFPNPIADLTRDLPPLLAALRCPIKLSKSALKAPSTPHSWPSVLSVLHWLVQLARVSDHIASSSAAADPPSDIDINNYITRSYSLFLAGDDVAVADLEAEYLDRLRRHAASSAKEVEALEAEVAMHEARARDLAGKPSRLEALEAERAVLVEDAGKFGNVVEKFSVLVEERREILAQRERELEKREMEKRRLDEENEELRQRIRGQSVSARDVERITTELQIVERDIADREARRNEMEEKSLLLDSALERKFREIEVLAEQSNHVIRK